MSLITNAEARQYLGITTSIDDALLNALLDSFSAFVATYTGRRIESTAYAQLYDGSGTARIILNEYPIISVTVLSQDLDHSTKKYSSPYAATDFFLATGGIVELYEDIFVELQRSVYVSYTAGFATIPGDLKDLVKQMVAKRYQDCKDKRFGMQSKNVFDDSITFDFKDLPDSGKTILDRYRKRPGAKNGVDVTSWTLA